MSPIAKWGGGFIAVVVGLTALGFLYKTGHPEPAPVAPVAASSSGTNVAASSRQTANATLPQKGSDGPVTTWGTEPAPVRVLNCASADRKQFDNYYYYDDGTFLHLAFLGEEATPFMWYAGNYARQGDTFTQIRLGSMGPPKVREVWEPMKMRVQITIELTRGAEGRLPGHTQK